MYQPFHRLRVRFAEMELRQGDVAQAAGMAKSTMTARMKGYQPWTSDEITRVAAVFEHSPGSRSESFFFEPSPQEQEGCMMANKRMFSVDVVETDAFLDLPPKTQALYFHLGMRADDDGFVSSPRTIVRTIGCTTGDLKQLEAAGYVISFSSGVLVVTDWKVNNTLKSDRYRKTMFQNELALLKESASKRYILSDNGTISEPIRNQSGNQQEPQYSIVKDSVEKCRLEQESNAAAAAGEPDTPPADIFTTFADGDGELLQALQDYDRMRKEKRKSLTDTMRRSLCQQLDEEFHRCEWVQIIKQATRQGWLKFYPLDKDKPTSTVPEFESAGDQISRIINDLKRKNGA